MNEITIDDKGKVFQVDDEKVSVKNKYLPVFYSGLLWMYPYYHGSEATPTPEFFWLLDEMNKVRRFTFEEINGTPRRPTSSQNYWTR